MSSYESWQQHMNPPASHLGYPSLQSIVQPSPGGLSSYSYGLTHAGVPVLGTQSVQLHIEIPDELSDWAESVQIQPILLQVKEATRINYISIIKGDGNKKLLLVDSPSLDGAKEAKGIIQLHLRNQLRLLAKMEQANSFKRELSAKQGSMARVIFEEFSVPESLIGVIIGKKGVRIQNIKEKCMVTSIDINQGVVKIMGTDMNGVRQARELIELQEESHALTEAQAIQIDRDYRIKVELKDASGVEIVNLFRDRISFIGTKQALRTARLALATQLEYVDQDIQIEQDKRETLKQTREFEAKYGLKRGNRDYGGRQAGEFAGRGRGGRGGRGYGQRVETNRVYDSSMKNNEAAENKSSTNAAKATTFPIKNKPREDAPVVPVLSNESTRGSSSVLSSALYSSRRRRETDAESVNNDEDDNAERTSKNPKGKRSSNNEENAGAISSAKAGNGRAKPTSEALSSTALKGSVQSADARHGKVRQALADKDGKGGKALASDLIDSVSALRIDDTSSKLVSSSSSSNNNNNNNNRGNSASNFRKQPLEGKGSAAANVQNKTLRAGLQHQQQQNQNASNSNKSAEVSGSKPSTATKPPIANNADSVPAAEATGKLYQTRKGAETAEENKANAVKNATDATPGSLKNRNSRRPANKVVVMESSATVASIVNANDSITAHTERLESAPSPEVVTSVSNQKSLSSTAAQSSMDNRTGKNSSAKKGNNNNNTSSNKNSVAKDSPKDSPKPSSAPAAATLPSTAFSSDKPEVKMTSKIDPSLTSSLTQPNLSSNQRREKAQAKNRSRTQVTEPTSANLDTSSSGTEPPVVRPPPTAPVSSTVRNKSATQLAFRGESAIDETKKSPPKVSEKTPTQTKASDKPATTSSTRSIRDINGKAVDNTASKGSLSAAPPANSTSATSGATSADAKTSVTAVSASYLELQSKSAPLPPRRQRNKKSNTHQSNSPEAGKTDAALEEKPSANSAGNVTLLAGKDSDVPTAESSAKVSEPTTFTASNSSSPKTNMKSGTAPDEAENVSAPNESNNKNSGESGKAPISASKKKPKKSPNKSERDRKGEVKAEKNDLVVPAFAISSEQDEF